MRRKPQASNEMLGERLFFTVCLAEEMAPLGPLSDHIMLVATHREEGEEENNQ